jgi:hypothetical protein
LRAAGTDAFFDCIEMLSEESVQRLAAYAPGGRTDRPEPGFWTAAELARRRTSGRPGVSSPSSIAEAGG